MPPNLKHPGGQPGHLYHKTPGWVGDGALFHVRIRAARNFAMALTNPKIAEGLLADAKRYHADGTWWCELFLVMPDHLHALLAFPREEGMSTTIRNWKRGAACFLDVSWQDNYFDHRIRTKKEAAEKWGYIRKNPVVKGLCAEIDEWPWWWSGWPRRSVAKTELLPIRPSGVADKQDC